MWHFFPFVCDSPSQVQRNPHQSEEAIFRVGREILMPTIFLPKKKQKNSRRFCFPLHSPNGTVGKEQTIHTDTHKKRQEQISVHRCLLSCPPPGARFSSGKNDSALRKRLTNSSPLPCVYVSQARVLGITPKANQQRRNRIVIVSCFFLLLLFFILLPRPFRRGQGLR